MRFFCFLCRLFGALVTASAPALAAEPGEAPLDPAVGRGEHRGAVQVSGRAGRGGYRTYGQSYSADVYANLKFVRVGVALAHWTKYDGGIFDEESGDRTHEYHAYATLEGKWFGGGALIGGARPLERSEVPSNHRQFGGVVFRVGKEESLHLQTKLALSYHAIDGFILGALWMRIGVPVYGPASLVLAVGGSVSGYLKMDGGPKLRVKGEGGPGTIDVTLSGGYSQLILPEDGYTGWHLGAAVALRF